MEREAQEKFEAVLSYFEGLSIKIPTEVKNAIQDVFEENESVENVESFFKQDINEFKHNEMKISNIANLYLNGNNDGSVVSTWTYYGEVDYSVTEKTTLFGDGSEAVEEITNIENEEPGIIYNEDDWVVVLYEKSNWDTRESKEITRKLSLYIYCPYFYDEEE